MADPIQMILHDHREVEEMFRTFESSGDREVAMQICSELEVHTTLEEELVYPILKRIDAELEREGEKEHDEADGLIRKAKGERDDARLREVMAELKKAVDHHVEEEETQALPELRERCADELREIAPRMGQRKQELTAEMQAGGGTKEELLDLTKDELYEKAKDADLSGRSKMNKDELAEALAEQG